MTRADRLTLVHQLRDEGMSQRAIAKRLKVSKDTVRRDLERIAAEDEPDDAPPTEPGDPAAPQVSDTVPGESAPDDAPPDEPEDAPPAEPGDPAAPQVSDTVREESAPDDAPPDEPEDAPPAEPGDPAAPQVSDTVREESAPDDAPPDEPEDAQQGAPVAQLRRMAHPRFEMDLRQWPAMRRDLAVLRQSGRSVEALVSQAVVVLAFGYRQALDRGELQPGEPFTVTDMTVRHALRPEAARPRT